MISQKLSRLAYCQGRAFGYRYVLENPDFTENQLLDAMIANLLEKDVFKRLDRIAKVKAKEAVKHVMFIHSTGKILEAIESSQGKFPAI